MAVRLRSPSDGPPWLPALVQSIGAYLDLLLSRLTLDRAIKTVTTTYTATNTDSTILADAAGGAFTVTLPKAVGVTGRVLTIKRLNSGANAVTVDGNGAETIDGSATASLASQYASVAIQSNGVAWFKI